MRIAFDAKRYYHNKTGLGNYSRTLVDGLRRLFPEHDYVLLDGNTFQRSFRQGREALSAGCQLYHGLSNELPLDSRSLRPSVVTLHDTAWRTYPEMYHWADRHIYDWKYGRTCQRADCVVCISESTKRDAMRFYGIPEERVRVIYQPVAQTYYTPLAADTARQAIREALPYLPADFVLYVGSINSRKNLLGLVRALHLLPKERRPFLLAVGNGRAYRREVEEFVENHGMASGFRIEADIHGCQLLQALYREALCFLYPSHYEGFGLPVVEAALQGTPVLTSTVSSLPEAAGPGACLVEPTDIGAMAAAIDRLLSDTAFSRSVGQNVEAYARSHFDPDTLLRQMMALYVELVQAQE